ncbi:MAG TPA: D-alanine--D-alanine ligase [Dongiaceae bacterium]|nr:D-alanine--D-alanine ligase [Dongiaceae bacterium]
MSDVADTLRLADLASPRRVASPFEFWPAPLFYAPVAAYWLWQALRHRSLTLPTLANPLMEYGGLCGESKTRQFEAMSPEGRQWLAPYVTIERGDPERVAEDLAKLLALAEAAGLRFPLVAKPDIGCHGAGVQVVHDPAELRAYLAGFPGGARLLLQHLVDCEGEAGIFYVRRPAERMGRIFSMTLKFFPQVTGDGTSTLRQLILEDPRASRAPHLYLGRHAARLGWVPARGERVRLVFAGNHCKGAAFRDGRDLITPALTERTDWLARTIPGFHFGRFDVRFSSLAELRAGRGFTAIEFNGGGSEAIHIWDPDMALPEAYRDLFQQVRYLFEIGASHRARGYVPDGIIAVARSWLRERMLKHSYPITQ